MAVIAAARPAQTQAASRLVAALKGAAGAALLTLGLAVPILAWRIDQDINSQPVLTWRWHYVAIAVALAFAARLGYLTIGPWATACGLLTLGLTYQHLTDALLGAPWDYLVIAAGCVCTAYAARTWLSPPAAELAGDKPAQRERSAMMASLGKAASGIGLVLLLLYPLLILALAGRSGAIKWIDNFGIQILIYVMLGWGLNIVVGLAGLLDLGYVAFYAVGAYSTALLSHNFGFSYWLCLPLAGIFAALWGIMLGFPVLRLRGDYLAIVTLAFGEIIRLVLINWVPVTNGYAGISGIPRPSFFGLPFNASDEGFAAVLGLEFSPLHRTLFLFYVILGLALITNWVTLRLRRLPVGRAWEALREDEIACRSLGINTTSTKLTAFAIGAGFGGFAGSFFAARQGFISPESFTFMESAVVVAIVVLGGMGSQLGVAIAAAAMIGGTELLRELDWLKKIFGPEFDPTQYRMLLFGFGMVAVMIWKPRGLISTRNPSIFLRERRAIGAGLVKEGHG